MTWIDGLLILISILLGYFLVVVLLHKKGILEKYGITLYGPALLLKTKKGLGFLKKLSSKKRFWKGYGNLAVIVCFISMIIIVFILVSQFTTMLSLDLTPAQKELLPGPEIALVLPGINPILPLDYLLYIIVALIVAIVVHEFSHGILAYIGNLKVKSMGILYMIIPLGAFVEPDEEQLKKTTIPKRIRLFAAGPMSNFVVALICLLLFSFVFMPAAQPIEGSEILFSYENTPADEINIPTGALIVSFNDTEIEGREDLSTALDNTKPNQTVTFSYLYKEKKYTKNVTLTSYYDVLEIVNESNLNTSKLKNTSFLGIAYNIFKADFISSMKNPLYDFPNGFANIYSIPVFYYIQGYNPLIEPFISNYELKGPLGILPKELFWGFTNLIYWVFWLNLLVGLFNVIPMVPLDGGFLFNDYIKAAIKKVKKDISKERLDKIVGNISLILSLVLLFIIIFPFFFKYI